MGKFFLDPPKKKKRLLGLQPRMGEARPPRDFFDGVLDIEERLVQEGRDEGMNAASALGILEGRSAFVA